MPNWCSNVAYIKHDNVEELNKIVKELEKDDESGLFNLLVPNPSGEWNYDWSVENWGTKWDASVYEYNMEKEHLYISFDTAWGPPIEFYNAILAQGFEIEAFYYEPGMAFAGYYLDGDLDEYNLVGMKAQEVAEKLPQNLNEMFSISDCMSDFEEFDETDADELDAILEQEVDNQAKIKLKEKLHSGIVKVTFTKKDGTDRVMLATLCEALIPDDKLPKGTGKTVDNGNTFAVYDTENDGWRSFNFDTVKELDYE